MQLSNAFRRRRKKRTRDLVSAISDLPQEQGFFERSEADVRENGGERDAQRTRVPVATLERHRDSACCHEAEKSLRSGLRDESRVGLHELRVEGAGAADELRVEAHRIG